ncbi:hypothetical protein Ari01nite_49750 [Paractinoplanes rishiriensis]|uniref:Uncharacterized protein n=1 Tax=Paractinoplanes rishiriensis TaxID=1050105 RepID=A0A919K1W1_9ACTN|nr:hypothetical protein Ari01nite_49750 [Actinoplanes rishiriensis]
MPEPQSRRSGKPGTYARRVETVVATGWWMYDGIVPIPVRVVMLDYDFWYALGEADGDLDPDEAPRLNPDGRLYYVRHRPGWPEGDQHFWPDSQGFLTLEEALAAAEAAISGPVRWQ